MILAPMAGVTDSAFRHICTLMGCKIAFCEMVSVNALLYDSVRTYELLDIAKNQEGLYIQIFGGDPNLMGQITEKLCNKYIGILKRVDINMGCPMPKIVKCGYGSGLLKDFDRAKKIVETVVKCSNVDVSVKIRKSFDENNIVALEYAKMIEQSGAKSICVHGRTAKQLYSGKADWDIIKQVKKNVSIPVVGNGDVFSYKDVQNMMDYTRCDDVLIARGAMGNPFIFSKRDVVSIKEKIETAMLHLNLACEYKDEKIAILEMRKHIAWYINNCYGSAAVRNKINCSKSKNEILDILNEYANNN